MPLWGKSGRIFGIFRHGLIPVFRIFFLLPFLPAVRAHRTVGLSNGSSSLFVKTPAVKACPFVRTSYSRTSLRSENGIRSRKRFLFFLSPDYNRTYVLIYDISFPGTARVSWKQKGFFTFSFFRDWKPEPEKILFIFCYVESEKLLQFL